MLDITRIYNRLADDVDLDPYSRAYLLNRLNNEGARFALEALPKFAKAVLSGIETGRLCKPSQLSNFAWKAGLPVFMRDSLKSIFDEQGFLLRQPCPVALLSIRQLCEYLNKLALGFDDDLLEESERKFLEVDMELDRSHPDSHFFEEGVRKFIERTFKFPPLHEILANYRPRYTPGTFSGNKPDYYAYKLSKGVAGAFLRKHRAISGFFKPYPAAPLGNMIENDTASRSELLFVPKVIGTPRVIVREPLKHLSVQMSYFDCLVDCIEKQSEYRVNFRDQQVNRELARAASIHGNLATLDMEKATDRVKTRSARRILRNTPLGWFLNQRMDEVLLPSGSTHRLRKLSGMGSGLTFPTMALLSYSASVVRVVQKGLATEREARRRIYFYGDDGIVPIEWVEAVREGLSLLGLVVNEAKSFFRPKLSRPSEPPFRGYFRESCGGDYLHGNEVTPVRLKLSSANPSVSGTSIGVGRNSTAAFVLQLERHCRELVKAQWHNLADYYYSVLEKIVGKLPDISGDSPYIGRYHHDSEPVYPTDDKGNYVTVRVVEVVARKKSFGERLCPYQAIASSLRPSMSHWADRFFPKGGSTCESGVEVTVPRSYKLSRRRVSALALT